MRDRKKNKQTNIELINKGLDKNEPKTKSFLCVTKFIHCEFHPKSMCRLVGHFSVSRSLARSLSLIHNTYVQNIFATFVHFCLLHS